jgi:hypothetical protein
MFEFERFDGPYTCEEIIEHHKYISVSDRECPNCGNYLWFPFGIDSAGNDYVLSGFGCRILLIDRSIFIDCSIDFNIFDECVVCGLVAT